MGENQFAGKQKDQIQKPHPAHLVEREREKKIFFNLSVERKKDGRPRAKSNREQRPETT